MKHCRIKHLFDPNGNFYLKIKQTINIKKLRFSHIILLFTGGFPNLESVSKRTQGRYDQPFKGCLQDIQFGAEPNALIKDFSAYQGENIGSCDLHGDEPIVV